MPPFFRTLLLAVGLLPLTALAQLTANAGADRILCAGATTTLGGTPTGSGMPGGFTYVWTPATGLSSNSVANPVAMVNTTTTYTVTVTSVNDASIQATDQVVVTVAPMPNVSINSSNATTLTYDGIRTFTICEPGVNSYTFNFNGGGSAQGGAIYTVIWGNGNTSTFTNSNWTASETFPLGLTQGTYTVTNPGPTACTRVVPFNVFIGEVPLGGLSVVSNTTICTGGSINFQWNDFSTNPPGTLYIIDFGDGQIDTVVHPPQAVMSHLYGQSSCVNGNGQYSIYWKIQNPCDFRDGSVNQIRVSQTPVAGFSLPSDTVCINVPVTISDQNLGMQAPSCADPRHLWNIAPGSYTIVSGTLGSVAGQPNNPGLWNSGSSTLTIQFNAPGTYTISDITGNVCGQDTITRTICVEAPPQPSFTLAPTTGCTPLAPTLDNTSQSPNSCLTRYNWQVTTTSTSCNSGATATYTGGTSASTFEPSLLFTGAGTYNVRLQAINSCGTFPVDRVVNVGAPPQVTVQPMAGICPGATVNPSATFTACNSPITTYTWSFVNGTPSSASTANPGPITFNTAGTSTITATATSACGSGTDSEPLVVAPAPLAPVVSGPISVCAGEDIVLQATPVPGITFTWTGPGGFSQTGNSVTRPMATTTMSGTYMVTPSGGGCPGPVSNVTVTVTAAPVISITPNAPSVCAGDPVTLTATGGGNYSWTVGGSPQGTGPSITYTPSGTQVVVVTSGQGQCPGSASTTVIVNTPPVVNAGPDVTYCAQPVQEQLQPTTPGGTWSGAGISPSGLFTPAGVGTFSFTYSLTSPQGCTSTDVAQVTVLPAPAAPMVSNDTLVCLNTAALQLAASPATGVWSGSVSTGGVFIPSTVGLHTLTYTLGSGSCAVSASVDVQVVNAAVVNAGVDLQRCINAPVVVLGATPIGGTWSGQGITGSSFSPVGAGVGSHTLTYVYADANGCIVSDALVAVVAPLPVVTAGNDITFCDQPIPQQLQGFSPAAGGNWSGPHVSGSGLFTPGGVGDFALTYSFTDGNNCSNSANITVSVIAIDEPAEAGLYPAVCIGSTAFNVTGAPVGGTWSGAGVSAAGLFTPSTAGPHTLTYSVGAGSCITQDQVTITVNPLPTPAITANADVCVDAGQQTLVATPSGGTWSGTGIVDGTLGTFDPNGAGVGQFPITYTYTDGNGCTNSTTDLAEVDPLPVATFTHAPIACVGVPFAFNNTSSGAVSWSWDFGDGTGSTAEDPQHSYTTPGNVDVTLIATTDQGCTHSISSPLTIWEGPTAAFTAGPALEGCAVLTVALQDQSYGAGITYAWDLGNGTTSTIPGPPPVDYVASAYRDTVYTITLAVTNQCATVSTSVEVTVHPAPTALFGPDFNTGCSPWPVTFSNVSIGEADTFVWDFGDGSGASTLDSLVTHTYLTGANDTTFTVTLTATNQCGTDVHTYDVTVQPNSITAFFNTSVTSGCAPLTVDLTQYSIGVTNWHWDLGDGNVSTAQDVTHTFPAGDWTVTLFGDNGCSYDTVSVDIAVSPIPVAAFSVDPQPVCAGQPVTLSNQTPAVASTEWTLPGGMTSTLSTFEHAFPTAGSFPVTLVVTAINNGCSASVTQQVTVAPVPVVGFTVSEAVYCAPATLTFTNTSTGTNLAYTWSMDGSGFSFLQHPLPQVMTSAGGHTVHLLVQDQLSGCRDSVSQVIMGNPTPHADFILQPVDPCGRPADLLATSTSTAGASTSWWLNGALLGTGAQLDTNVVGAGSYTLALVAESLGPCSDTARTTFTLHELPVAAFTADTACVGQPIPLTDASLHTIAQWWYLNGRPVGTDPLTLSMVPSTPGVDTIALAVLGLGGCMDSLVVLVNTYVAPPAAMTVEVLDDCRSIRLHGLAHPQVQYAWFVNDLDQPFSTDREPWYFYARTTALDLHFRLEVTNVFGCTSEDLRPVDLPLCTFVANAFTPDGDGINETFLPSVTPDAKWQHFRVFDRWGEEIFTTTPNGPEWDGTVNGKPAPPGVYVWRLELTPTEEAQDPLYGHVTLVR